MGIVTLITFVSISMFAHAQEVPIPPRTLGYVYAYGTRTNLTAVTIDAFFDPLCPDSKQAFPTLLQVANHYGPDVLTLRLHMFPLPYHRNSFLVSMGTEVINQMSTSTNGVYDWAKRVYDNIYSLSNAATHTRSEADVTNMLGDIAAQMGLQKATFLQKIADPWVDMHVRMDWKYACTRGVSGTPLYAINNVVKLIDKAWSLHDWMKIIDPLVHNSYIFHVPV
ncbi:uncharacterized protein LOC133176107 [Saccostrea echinata]|uniref:uncharacterized protein LOC133176107 n=1 Tax=Saccostrea echinata TaxID=191078 RepID=UPI002A818734|nr:uncharacterized protein LOC133176107 [Saccostrea echinata]